MKLQLVLSLGLAALVAVHANENNEEDTKTVASAILESMMKTLKDENSCGDVLKNCEDEAGLDVASSKKGDKKDDDDEDTADDKTDDQEEDEEKTEDKKEEDTTDDDDEEEDTTDDDDEEEDTTDDDKTDGKKDEGLTTQELGAAKTCLKALVPLVVGGEQTKKQEECVKDLTKIYEENYALTDADVDELFNGSEEKNVEDLQKELTDSKSCGEVLAVCADGDAGLEEASSKKDDEDLTPEELDAAKGCLKNSISLQDETKEAEKCVEELTKMHEEYFPLVLGDAEIDELFSSVVQGQQDDNGAGNDGEGKDGGGPDSTMIGAAVGVGLVGAAGGIFYMSRKKDNADIPGQMNNMGGGHTTGYSVGNDNNRFTQQTTGYTTGNDSSRYTTQTTGVSVGGSSMPTNISGYNNQTLSVASPVHMSANQYSSAQYSNYEPQQYQPQYSAQSNEWAQTNF